MTRKLFLFIIEITFELIYRKILKAVQTIEDDQTAKTSLAAEGRVWRVTQGYRG